MLPANGENFSCHKEKEVVVDDLPIEVVGGEAPHSDTDHFEEEKGVTTRVVNVLLSLTRGMTLTFIS